MWWEGKMVYSLFESSPAVFQKLNIKLPYNLAIPLLDIYIQENSKKMSIQKLTLKY